MGDRETVIAAAEAMGQKYYLTEHRMAFAGFIRETYIQKQKYFDSTTIVKRDPQEAFESGKRWRLWLRKQKMDTRMSPYQQNDFTLELQKKFFHDHSRLADPTPLSPC